MKVPIEQIKFDERGLVPAVVQDFNTRQVLTLAYMNAESLRPKRKRPGSSRARVRVCGTKARLQATRCA